MKCDVVRERLAFLLYGELSFEEEEQVESHLDGCPACAEALSRQRVLHAALDRVEPEPPADLLWQCRQDLQRTIRDLRPEPWWKRYIPHVGSIAWLQVAGAMAMLAVGFFAARWTQTGDSLALSNPSGAKVRYVEAGAPGEVRIVLDETRQRTVSGRLDDQNIQSLLFTAVKDQADPGLRVQSIGLLNNHAQSSEVRDALIFALSHDNNDGVRMKALDGLKAFARDPEVQTALTQALLHDTNAGLRAQAVDLLTQGGAAGMDPRVVGTLQELLGREDNAYVRQRSKSALQAVKASAEIF